MKATLAILIHPIVACRPGLSRPSTQRACRSPSLLGRNFLEIPSREDEQSRRRSRPVDAIDKSHPGRACAQKEQSGSFSYLRRLDDLAALVVAAVGADRVWPSRLLAVRARLEHHERQRQVGAAASFLGLG